jgi:hypothetical protein
MIVLRRTPNGRAPARLRDYGHTGRYPHAEQG